MRKIFLIFLLCFVMSMASSVMAADISMDIADAEAEISSAATISQDYSKDMLIDSRLVDAAAKAAISKEREYDDSEISQYKNLEANVVVDLKNTDTDISIRLGNDLSSYRDYIDNIIINANGIKCYVKTSDFSFDNRDENSIGLSIEDEGNVIGKYSGNAVINQSKLILIVVFVAVALYIFVFINFFVLRKKFNENYNKKIICIIGYVMAAFCVIAAVFLFLWDSSSMAKQKSVDINTGEEYVFSVEIEGGNQEINGLSMSIPLYSDSFSTQKTTACMKSKDALSGDIIIGGRYINTDNSIKFVVNKSGEYYLRNNDVAFSDISDSNEGLYEAVSILAAQNIITGKADGIYGANDTVTRAEAVTMLCKMLGIDNLSFNSEGFDDVKSENWYYKYVMIGKENGVLSGYDDNTFKPENTISRQEFAGILGQIMVNKMGYMMPSDTSNLNKYADRDLISFWAVDYISILENEGINIWTEAYEPQIPITRGEAAMMIYRVYLLMK